MFKSKMKSDLVISEDGTAIYQFEYDNLATGFSRKIRKTTIEVKNERVKLLEKLERPFRKVKENKTEVNVANINQIMTKKTVYWDSIFWVIIGTFAGFMYPMTFLFVGVILYFGIRKVLVIKTTKGDIKILIKGSNNDVDDLVRRLCDINPEILTK